ncbi:DUF3081 domain-containing protein [Vibrio sp. SM6]|uniref:DUF3081 domain-containing protein n=1 Tax=Vibrio agarilyticus TaxID=2726741 RepID=A0A7X8TN97_9VIBR|nr:DUF3081 family protein [Vibrio agarilyticus]NLS11907.1 DUF3081 domain-containing protein [Vibrio agarilyticus]
MQNELEISKVLEVFEWIRRHGEATDNGYRYDDMEVTSDYDGYTLYFAAHDVTLTIGFHQTYLWHYDDANHKERFMASLNRLIAKVDESEDEGYHEE